ncbi:hypothetical protein GCM10008023_05560 [Sphingomonas glacialis]|uniref:Uncharacterized protein n=2 Tax=Sphingomonas glacialis TaxID=658225 RepID=A0ABQ3LBH7_9SPHN|nr:hypothetical protein GCM10008023_05560 [Sphingomonas glacialis]
MKDSCYIVLSEYGIERMTKRQGSLKRNEVAVKVNLSIADSVFAEPAISAAIVIPASAVIHPDIEVTVEDQEPSA